MKRGGRTRRADRHRLRRLLDAWFLHSAKMGEMEREKERKSERVERMRGHNHGGGGGGGVGGRAELMDR